jgi:Xaa-Pro aminopeptidase
VCAPGKGAGNNAGRDFLFEMKAIPLPAGLFTLNRERLTRALLPHSVAVLNANDIMPTNADGTMGHLQKADLFYLTGIHQEETMLLLAPEAFDPKHREVLFVRQPNEHLAIWEGHKLTKEQASKISGIKNVKWLSEFPALFRQIACESDVIYLNSNEHQRAGIEVETRDQRFGRECQRMFPLHRYERLARVMHSLRVVKSDAEIAAIKNACDLTGQGFQRVCKFVKPGVNEAEVEAEFAHEFIRHKGKFAYPPIIATGANNNILHYGQKRSAVPERGVVIARRGRGTGQLHERSHARHSRQWPVHAPPEAGV